MGAGSDWLAAYPYNPCPERDEHVMAAAESGLLNCDWASVTSFDRGRRATIPVTADALYVVLDDGSRFRPMVTAKLQQRLADHFGGYLPTSKVCDLAYDQASPQIDAQTILDVDHMMTSELSKKWNVMMEAQRAGRTGLVRDCGKSWILSNLLSQRQDVGVNYGYFSHKAPYESHSGYRMWQTRGSRHNAEHQDFSQVCHLMGGVALVFDEGVPMETMLTHPNYYEIVSDEGALKLTRQP